MFDDKEDQITEAVKRKKDLVYSITQMQKEVLHLRRENEATLRLEQEDEYESKQQASAPTKTASESLQRYTDYAESVFEDILSSSLVTTHSLEVQVVFRDATVRFSLSHTDTFHDLSIQASHFWSIPEPFIFFSDQAGVLSPLFMRQENVFQAMCPWGELKPTNYIPKVYIKFESHNEPEDILYQPEILEESLETDQRLLGDEKPPEPVKCELTARLKRKSVVTLLDALLLLFLVTLWVFGIWIYIEPRSSSYMTDSALQSLSIILRDTSANAFQPRTIYSARGYWGYINSLNDILHNSPQQYTDLGALSSFSFCYEGVQMNQLRSNNRTCDHEYYGSIECPQKWSWDPQTEDWAEEEGFQYDSDGNWVLVPGFYDIYTLAGFKADLSTRDQTDWDSTVALLRQNDWIDRQTRAIFTTFNLVYPNTGAVVTVMFIAEISENYSWITDFIVQHYRYDYTPSLLWGFSLATVCFCIVGIYSRLRISCLSRRERACIALFRHHWLCLRPNRGLPAKADRAALFSKFRRHDHKSWRKKLKKTTWFDRCYLAVLMIGLLLQLWFFLYTVLLRASVKLNSGEYTDLYADIALLGVALDVMFFELLLLFVLLVGLVYEWIPPTQVFVKTIGVALQEGAAPAFVILLFMLGVSVVYFFLFGATTIQFSALSLSYYSTLGLILGQFGYNDDMANIVGMLQTGTFLLIVRFVTFLTMIYLSCVLTLSLLQHWTSSLSSGIKVHPKKWQSHKLF